jgi:hypothetical protein
MPTDEPFPTLGRNFLLPSPVHFKKYILSLEGGFYGKVDMARYPITLELHRHRLENLKSRNMNVQLQIEILYCFLNPFKPRAYLIDVK